MGNIFVRRPIFAMVIAIFIVILGVISLISIPIEQYPDITPPMVEVGATYQGADAITVEESVATPIEENVNGVENMLYMQSTNSSNGTMSLQVSFAIGSDPDINTILTQNRVSTATPQLPPEVITQGVTTTKTMTSFVQVMSLYSDGEYDGTFLTNYAIINIKDRLSRINGVGKVDVMGAGAYAMRIWLDPDKLDYMNITASQIAAAINAQSQVTPGGQLGSEPAVPGTDFTYTVRMPAQYSTVEEFENIIIRTNPDGSLVRIKDVARVELGAQNYGVVASFMDKPSALIIIYQSPGSNAVQVGNDVKAAMAELSPRFPAGIHYDMIVDATHTIKTGIEEIVWTLVFALVLVVIVIYIFLQDLRATIVPVIAIPVSLVGAFILFPALGFSVNVFSLLGLVLAIGLVVDDAIVVVEAVQVGIEQGKSPKDATNDAMKMVASPIIATTLVLMAVFLPVGLMPGAAGRLYQQFALTIALSVAISGINALSLSPALCSILLKKRSGESKTQKAFGGFNRMFNNFVTRYLKTSSIIVRHGLRTFIFIVIITGATLFIMRGIPVGLLPNEDQGYLMSNIQLPNASSLERTRATISNVDKILRSNPNVESTTSAAGFSMLSGTAAPNTGLIFIKLKDWSKRKETASELTNIFNMQLYEGINSGQVFVFGPPSIPGLGASSGFTIMIQDRGGNSPEYLAEYTDKFIAAAKKRPEISSISTLYQAQTPQRILKIDNEAAMKSGVSLEQLHNMISTYLGAQYVNNFTRFGRTYQIYMQADSQFRTEDNSLGNYYVINDQGVKIPMSSFVRKIDTTGAQFTNRFNLYRSAQVTGIPSPKYSSTQAMDALAETADEVLPADMGYAWSNMSYQEAQNTGAGIVFFYAVVFVFLILAALYESWSLPVSILLGIPFAIFGAMLFTFIAHMVDSVYINDVFLQISLVLLIGLAAKNAILIVEYAQDEFKKGLSLVDAAIEAAKLRVRPIIMTVMTFLVGILPLIFATGSNAVARNVMGLALFGGMFIATVIGLFVYPALFVLIGKLGKYEQKRDKQHETA